MRLEHLRYLIEIDCQRSISSAARTLFVGQTTLSSIVKSVEDALGFSIFQRTPQGVLTTFMGEQVITLARAIIAKYEDALLEGQQAKVNTNPVSILLTPSLSAALSLGMNQAFLQEEPRTTLLFLEAPRTELGLQIVQNVANIGLTHLKACDVENFAPTAKKYGIELTCLAEDHFFLLVRCNHPLANKKSVALHELFQERLAMASFFTTAVAGQLLAPLYRNNTCYTAFSNIEQVRRAVFEQGMPTVLTGCVLSLGGFMDCPEFCIIPLTDLDGENLIYVYLLNRSDLYLRSAEKKLVSCSKKLITEAHFPPYCGGLATEL